MARFPHTLGVLAAVVALTASGCTSASPRPSVSRPAPSSPNAAHGDFAGLVDIGGGHKLFLECHGSGSPTVILLSGYGNAGDIWNEADAHPPAVAPGVARFTRECAYDRPGSLRVVTDAGTPAPSALPGDQITAMSAQAAERAFVLLALQAPVAGDLRAIIGAIQIAANIDRMGALALHVAKIARRRHPQHALPEQVNGYFAEMGRVAVELGNSTREVLLTHDPDKAARIDEEDDAMDDLHRRLFSVLMDHDWKHGVAAAVDITLLGRFYERFADHTVEVARRVIFQSTGKSPQKTD